jgi:DNA-binding transcriptional ArsR family regulator
MRPLVHPSIGDVTVEGILYALSDPVRVAIYGEIVGSDCSHNCSSFLKVRDREIPKSTLSQHFKILRDAGLIRSERHGVQMHNSSRCAEIDSRFPGLIAAILKAHKLQSEGRRSGPKARKRKPEGRSAAGR